MHMISSEVLAWKILCKIICGTRCTITACNYSSCPQTIDYTSPRGGVSVVNSDNNLPEVTSTLLIYQVWHQHSADLSGSLQYSADISGMTAVFCWYIRYGSRTLLIYQVLHQYSNDISGMALVMCWSIRYAFSILLIYQVWQQYSADISGRVVELCWYIR